MTQTELEKLCGIACAAGAGIMDIYAKGFSVYHKSDSSPLTEADLCSDQIIRSSLEASFPGCVIWSEESMSSGHQKTENFFLVDPLDGTKEFLQRSGEFTVNIAWVEAGQVTAGVVFAPALGEMFFAAQGLGAWKRDANKLHPIGVKTGGSDLALRILGSRSHGVDRLRSCLAKVKRPYSFVAAGSSLKFCRIAEGAADLYVRLGPTSQWDTAAAQCVLEQAGGQVLDKRGRPLRYGLNLPVLNPDFCATSLPWEEIASVMNEDG